MTEPIRHEYGKPSFDYIGTWFGREDDGPGASAGEGRYQGGVTAPDPEHGAT